MFKLQAQPYKIVENIYRGELNKEKAKEKAETFLKGVVDDPLKYYVPTGANEDYIRTVAESTKESNVPVILCTYANSTGKTNSTINIILNIIYGPQNGWFDYELFRNFPFPKKIWYISNAEALKSRVIPEFEYLLKSKGGTYKTYKDNYPYISRIEFDNGWTIYFKTFDQDPKTFESLRLGIIVADEPMPEVLWRACEGRMTLGCISLLPQTPLDCPPYILDEISAGADRGDKGYFHLTADIYSACKERGIRGFLDANTVDETVARYTEDEKKARAFGSFMYFAGKIYPDLDMKIHYVNPEDYPLKSNYLYFHIIDPHDGRPTAEIWACLCPNGRRIVFDERPDDKSRPFWEMKGNSETPAEHKVQIEFKERLYEGIFANPDRIMDRHWGAQTRGENKKTAFQSYNDVGLIFRESYNAVNEVEYGHRKVRECLKILPDGKPGLVIWNTCYHTWQGLTHSIYKSLTGKSSGDKIQGKIVEKYKDFDDLIRYLCCEDQQPESIPIEKHETHTDMYDYI